MDAKKEIVEVTEKAITPVETLVESAKPLTRVKSKEVIALGTGIIIGAGGYLAVTKIVVPGAKKLVCKFSRKKEHKKMVKVNEGKKQVASESEK